MMKCVVFNESRSEETIALFKSVFAASEGETEGRIIADFVSKLIATTAPEDLVGCVAEEDGCFVGCLFFSRLIVPGEHVAFIMSPVAVLTDVQRSGIGQKLIRYGLAHLRSLDVTLAFTYGDPCYYAKTGFHHIAESVVSAPLPLSHPMGWLAQSLDGQAVQPLDGPTFCVEALKDPGLW